MITIQVGQCGNQVGTSFFDTIAGELMNAKDSKTESEEATMAKYTFFRDSKEKLVSRTVLVDTEPKVIAEAMNRNHKNWSYGKDMYVCEQTGSGNNWAYGNRVHAKRLRHSVKDKIRRLVEETDSFPSFHILQSVAGGTKCTFKIIYISTYTIINYIMYLVSNTNRYGFRCRNEYD